MKITFRSYQNNVEMIQMASTAAILQTNKLETCYTSHRRQTYTDQTTLKAFCIISLAALQPVQTNRITTAIRATQHQ